VDLEISEKKHWGNRLKSPNEFRRKTSELRTTNEWNFIGGSEKVE
jgi:hypothetical protein